MKKQDDTFEGRYGVWLWQQDAESLLTILNLSDEDLAEFNYHEESVTKEELVYTFEPALHDYFEGTL